MEVAAAFVLFKLKLLNTRKYLTRLTNKVGRGDKDGFFAEKRGTMAANVEAEVVEFFCR